MAVFILLDKQIRKGSLSFASLTGAPKVYNPTITLKLDAPHGPGHDLGSGTVLPGFEWPLAKHFARLERPKAD